LNFDVLCPALDYYNSLLSPIRLINTDSLSADNTLLRNVHHSFLSDLY